MWTIPHHGGLGGIVGVHYFSQMSWPVHFFVFTQLPDNSHDGLMWSLHQPIHLWMVWHGLQFPHAKEFAHLINDTACEVSTPITKEPGWVSEDWYVTLIQELGDCFSCLIRGHICHYVLHIMVLEHQDIGSFRQSVQYQVLCYASKVLHARGPLEWWSQLGIEAFWTNCPHVSSNMHRT